MSHVLINKMLLRLKKAAFTLGSINLVAMEKNLNGCNFMCARRSGNILFYFYFIYFLLTTLLVQKIQNLIKRTVLVFVSVYMEITD